MHKTVALIVFVVSLCFGIKAQHLVRKPSLLGINFTLIDFNTAAEIKAGGIGQLFSPKLSGMRPGLAINYMKGLSNHFDLSVSGAGSFVDYPIKNRPPFGSNHLLLQITTMVNMKWKTDKHLFTPYITAGAGFSQYKGYYGLSVPAGLGLQFNFKNEVYVLVQSHYAFAASSNVSNNVFHTIGIAGNLKKQKRKTASIQPALQPADLSKQDRDGDGIIDSDDKCPTIPGVEKYAGCPVPDTDSDGLNDEVDSCPSVYGVRRYNGCPVPDTDGDGVNDEQDNCITEKGPLNNKGCPVIDTADIQAINTSATQIFFETGKAVLLKQSFAALDTIAAILMSNPVYQIIIEGHTDNQGNKAANQVLSENRAKVVFEYLLKKGVTEERMKFEGFGQDKPVADNRSYEGRAMNRRVEIKVVNFLH